MSSKDPIDYGNVWLTRDELREYATSHMPATFTIDTLAHKIREDRRRMAGDMTGVSTTGEKIREQNQMNKNAPSIEKLEITEAELEAAFIRRATRHGWTPDDTGASVDARDMFTDLKNHKDPDLDDGCVVIDASNDLWQYVENEQDVERGWNSFGTTTVYPYDEPKRPIERVDVEAVKAKATY